MRHGRRRGRLGLNQEHRRSLLRNLARGLIIHQEIITTHNKAKETSRFVDQLVTIAKQNSLYARRRLIQELGSGSEELAKKMMATIAPKLADRKGGYTRVLRYKHRVGDGANLSLLQFTVPIETVEKKPKKEKKSAKAAPASAAPKTEKPAKKEEPKAKEKAHKETTEQTQKEAPKKGGFLSKLRKFLKGDEEGK